jgi:hypothetical protein
MVAALAILGLFPKKLPFWWPHRQAAGLDNTNFPQDTPFFRF